MNEKLIAAVGVLVLAVLAYAPVIWIVYRYVRFRPMIRFFYALTAAPQFLGLLLVNIGLIERFWPSGPQFLRNARPIRDRVRIFALLLVLCVVAVVGSWLWYRLFTWLNQLLGADAPNDQPGSK